MANPKYLNPTYKAGNALRDIGMLADNIEAEYKTSVLRLNVGDPTNEISQKSVQAMIQHLQGRGLQTGYDLAAGNPYLREEVAKSLTTIARLDEKKIRGVYAAMKAEYEGYKKEDPSPHNTMFCDAQLAKMKSMADGKLSMANVFVTNGGTGALNIAATIFGDTDKEPPVKPLMLVPSPFYPPWKKIALRNNNSIQTYITASGGEHIIDKNALRHQLVKATQADPSRPIVMLYHFPNNPLGTTLTEQQAKDVAHTLSELAAEFKQLHFVQEDVYLATIRPDLALHTPLAHLSDDALLRTLWLHSPSKEGHGQDRGALIATMDPNIADRITNAIALDSLGGPTPALVGTVCTLRDLAKGIDPLPPGTEIKKYDDSHLRYRIAQYYHDRMNIMADAFSVIETELQSTKQMKPEQHILDGGKAPEGTYYLWPSLAFMKGKPIPKELRGLKFKDQDGIVEEVFKHATIEDTNDIKMILAHAAKLGLRPVTVAQGEIFLENNSEFRMRLAAVDRNLDNMKNAANTFKGVIAKVMDPENKNKLMEKMGVKTITHEELIDTYKPGGVRKHNPVNSIEIAEGIVRQNDHGGL